LEQDEIGLDQAVIASAAKQSMAARDALNCFVALAMTIPSQGYVSGFQMMIPR
jgi:hypothetical protein